MTHYKRQMQPPDHDYLLDQSSESWTVEGQYVDCTVYFWMKNKAFSSVS